MQQKLLQAFFCKIYCFLKRCQRVFKMRFSRRWEIFIFHPILMGCFASMTFKKYVDRFSLSPTVFELKGVKVVFGGGGFNYVYYFWSDFDGVFFQMISQKNETKVTSSVFVAVSDFGIKGVKWLKNSILKEMRNIFLFDFDGFFAFDSSQW